jgi:hypothetical protein
VVVFIWLPVSLAGPTCPRRLAPASRYNEMTSTERRYLSPTYNDEPNQQYLLSLSLLSLPSLSFSSPPPPSFSFCLSLSNTQTRAHTHTHTHAHHHTHHSWCSFLLPHSLYLSLSHSLSPLLPPPPSFIFSLSLSLLSLSLSHTHIHTYTWGCAVKLDTKMGNSEPNGADGKLVSQDRTLSSEDEPQKAVLDRVGVPQRRLCAGKNIRKENKMSKLSSNTHTHTHPSCFSFDPPPTLSLSRALSHSLSLLPLSSLSSFPFCFSPSL